MTKKYMADDIIEVLNKNSTYLISDKSQPFICQVCGKVFKRIRDLNFHLTTLKHKQSDFKILKKNHLQLQFLKMIKINNDECWEWQGHIAYDGYGSYGKIAAHRLSYELFNKKIEHDKLICHDCDNTICINPKHLYEGTFQTNMDDMVRRGRSLKGDRNPSKREDVKVKLRKTYICTRPDGIVEEVKNLMKYCKDNNINYRTMLEAGGGKGWLCRKK